MAFRGIRWTSISLVIKTLLQFVQISFLAQFLDKKDFGLMAIVLVVIGFSRIFSDMGLSNAIIHRKDPTQNELSSLYWINVTSGIIIFILLFFISSPVAAFYNEPEISQLIKIVAIAFLIEPFGHQFRVLHRKEFRFEIIAKIEIIAIAISTIVAVLAALWGLGVYSLVLAHLCNILILSLLFILKGVKYFKPHFYFNRKDLKGYISFGLFQLGDKTINYFNKQIDVLLIGKLFGTEALGIYVIAKIIVNKPVQITSPIVSRVGFPLYAKIQDNIPKLRNIYLNSLTYLSSVNFPIYFLIALLAEPIIFFFFGKDWYEAIYLIRILSLFIMFRSIGNLSGSLVLARGRADLGFFWNLGKIFIIPCFIYLSSFWGLKGIVWSLLILQVFLLIPAWRILVFPSCKAGIFEYFSSVARPLIISFLSAVLGVSLLLLISNLYLIIILVPISFGLSYYYLTLKHNGKFLSEIKQLLLR